MATKTEKLAEIRPRVLPAGRNGDQITVYLYFPERTRVEQLAREMKWPRGRTINALIAHAIPASREGRKALAKALVAVDAATPGAKANGR